jgi:hypothetical protein
VPSRVEDQDLGAVGGDRALPDQRAVASHQHGDARRVRGEHERLVPRLLEAGNRPEN